MTLLLNPVPETWYIAKEYYPAQSTEVLAMSKNGRMWIDTAGVEGEWGTGCRPDFAWKIVINPFRNGMD